MTVIANLVLVAAAVLAGLLLTAALVLVIVSITRNSRQDSSHAA